MPSLDHIHSEASPQRSARDAAADAVARLAEGLEPYGELADRLPATAGALDGFADDVRLFSLNAALAAARLPEGRALSMVASLVRGQASEIATTLRQFDASTAETVEAVRLAGHLVTAAAEQIAVEREADVLATVLAACDQLAAVRCSLQELVAAVARTRHGLDIVRSLEFNGRLEAVRAEAGHDVVTMFSTIARQVEGAYRALDTLATLPWLAEVTHTERREHALATARRLAEELRAAQPPLSDGPAG
jgi:methyl-accepting chemotaxis protein